MGGTWGRREREGGGRGKREGGGGVRGREEGRGTSEREGKMMSVHISRLVVS